MLLDFWATWCDPCQAPMAKNNDMVFLNEDNWKGKVRIIGLNIDESKKLAQKHITEKDWLKIEHYHVAQEKCDAGEKYGGEGIPHVVLVDTHGTIVYVGHPSTRNLE